MLVKKLGISGSKVDRALACAGSVILPQVNEVAEEADDNPAERGTAIHAFLATVNEAGREKALEAVEEKYRELCACIDVEALPTLNGSAYSVEVALAYNVLTGEGREIGRNIGREYGELGEWELPMSLDVLGLAEDDLVIWDYKSGWSEPPPPEDNWQLTVNALGARAVFGMHGAFVGLIRLPAFRTPWSKRAYLDAFTLDERAEQLREAALAIVKLREEYAQNPSIDLGLTRGSHCRYCGALPICRAQAELVHAATGHPADYSALVVPPLTEETAAAAYARIQEVRRILDFVEDQLSTFSFTRPFRLANGDVFGPIVGKTEGLDGETTFKVLTEKYGTEFAEKAVERSATKTSVERAVRALVAEQGGKIAPLMREALVLLREGGAVSVKESVSVKAHKERSNAANGRAGT